MNLEYIWPIFLTDKHGPINCQLPGLGLCQRMMTVIDDEQFASVRRLSETVMGSSMRVGCRLHDWIVLILFPWSKWTV